MALNTTRGRRVLRRIGAVTAAGLLVGTLGVPVVQAQETVVDQAEEALLAAEADLADIPYPIELATVSDTVAEATGTTSDAIDTLYASVEDAPYAVAAGSAGTPETAEAVSGWNDATSIAFAELSYPGSLSNVREQIGTAAFWEQGWKGDGIDIAIIDSGVVPVDGLDDPYKMVNGPDLSFESQSDSARYLDTFGHGTHLAGIMVGDSAELTGIAPEARLVSLKVASHDGAVDVTQMIAAIDWVVQNRESGDLNIRVLNLSYGTQSLQPYQIDALAHAVQQAWEAGIVVVVAAGNDGVGVQLRSPAYNPTVIAVGAADGSLIGQGVNAIADYSSCGIGARKVDVVAPGRSIVSYRNPGSFADVHFPNAAVGEHLFMGSGTSQATAVVAGAVALLLDERPHLSPDQVKDLITDTATPLPASDSDCQGSGLIDLDAAQAAATPSATDAGAATTYGVGYLDASRGGYHIAHKGVVLMGNFDIFGAPFRRLPWAARADQGTSWNSGTWNGNLWAGAGWTGDSWTSMTWGSATWTGTSWSGVSWASEGWQGGSWSGGSWSGGSWSGGSWSGGSWSGGSWSGGSWSGGSWSGGSWSGGSWSSGSWS